MSENQAEYVTGNEGKRQITSVKIEFDSGELIDIKNLERVDYEEMLDLFMRLRIAYIAIQR